MKGELSFFNWSLTRLLNTEPDNLKKARINIIFAIIIFLCSISSKNIKLFRETVPLSKFSLLRSNFFQKEFSSIVRNFS